MRCANRTLIAALDDFFVVLDEEDAPTAYRCLPSVCYAPDEQIIAQAYKIANQVCFMIFAIVFDVFFVFLLFLLLKIQFVTIFITIFSYNFFSVLKIELDCCVLNVPTIMFQLRRLPTENTLAFIVTKQIGCLSH